MARPDVRLGFSEQTDREPHQLATQVRHGADVIPVGGLGFIEVRHITGKQIEEGVHVALVDLVLDLRRTAAGASGAGAPGAERGPVVPARA